MCARQHIRTQQMMSYAMTSYAWETRVLTKSEILKQKMETFSFHLQMLEASLYIAENLPDGPSGLWALIHAECFTALGELEWIPFPVMRKALDINVLGTFKI